MDDTSKLKRIDLGSHSDVVTVCRDFTTLRNLDTLVMYVNDYRIIQEYQNAIFSSKTQNNIKTIALCGIKRDAWCSCSNLFRTTPVSTCNASTYRGWTTKRYPEFFNPLMHAVMIRFPQLRRLEYWSIAALGDMKDCTGGPLGSRRRRRRPRGPGAPVDFAEDVVPASVVHLTLRLKNRNVTPQNRLYIAFLERLVRFFDDLVEAIEQRGAFADLRAIDLEMPAGSVLQVLRDIGTKIQKVESKIESRILDSAITPRWIVSGRYHSDFTPVVE
ncbi:hypothetical protein BS50DRAFT_634120 [Corynespora cassiicola Philippines]|uniref:Uncharacterized protein n=1 Tax=Corynespora cassiicola Philippines TaxID=1448308 RepID=A0A2T2NNH8_CORCC|nr:hypothetical protein BS50DRAFT_634120 [Corynespora cassiicola Philippines]